MNDSSNRPQVDVNKPLTNTALRKYLDEMAQSPSPEAEDRVLKEIVLRAHCNIIGATKTRCQRKSDHHKGYDDEISGVNGKR